MGAVCLTDTSYMKRIVLTIPQRMLLALLNASLQGRAPETDVFDNATPSDWKACCDLAVKQGVMALAWDGIVKLPKQQMPPQDLKIAWALAVEKYEGKYAYYCQVVAELAELYQKHGIRMVQLKGVGLSTYYPCPRHREGGDIDIFTCSADRNKLTDKEAHDLADKLMEEQDIEVDYGHPKHSEWYYKGIPIENHITLLDVGIGELVQQAEGILRECMHPQLVMLPTGKQIYIPSVEFNTLFVAFHTAQHYGHGLALHHLYDWACIIKQYGVRMPDGITDRHFLRGIDAMNYLCNSYLGTSVEVSRKGRRVAAEILEEIFEPYEGGEMPARGLWKQLRFKARRFVRMVRVNNTFFYTPLWRKAAFWQKIRKSIAWHLSMRWR